MAGGALSSACLIGRDNAQIWGQTPGFGPKIYNASVSVEDASGNISEVQQQVNEAVDLVNYVKTKKKSAAGFRINGVKYTTVRTFQENEYGFFTVYGAKGVSVSIADFVFCQGNNKVKVWKNDVSINFLFCL
jgi:hypothetical protein